MSGARSPAASGVVFGLAAAGLAFAIQEVIGALAGWLNIITGGVFDFIWEQLTLPVPYHSDWRQAEGILAEEVERVSASEPARAAISTMVSRYPVGRTDLEPRVFVRATDNWNELSARFSVPVRSARLVKDRLTRRVLDRFAAAGIRIASETSEVTLHVEDGVEGGE